MVGLWYPDDLMCPGQIEKKKNKNKKQNKTKQTNKQNVPHVKVRSSNMKVSEAVIAENFMNKHSEESFLGFKLKDELQGKKNTELSVVGVQEQTP